MSKKKGVSDNSYTINVFYIMHERQKLVKAKKKHKFKVSVDTGHIVAFLTLNPTEKSMPIKKGKYKIVLEVADSYRGPNSNFNFLDVKKDSFLSLDDIALNDDGEPSNIEDNIYKKGCVIDTGGDGTFSVIVNLKRISKLGPNPLIIKIRKAKMFLEKNKLKGCDSIVDEYLRLFYSGYAERQVRNLFDNRRTKEMRKSLKQIESFLNRAKTNK